MKPLEKHNVGRGDYWILRSDASTKNALIEDLCQLQERGDLAFPIFVSTMAPGFMVSVNFDNKDQLRFFCQGYGFAVK